MDTRATLKGSFWLACKDDAIAATALTGGPQLFAVRIQGSGNDAVAPTDTVFCLTGAHAPSRGKPLGFTWTHRGGFPLPSMRGEIVARRFGPVLAVSVRAEYAYDDGPAGRLFHEAIGEKLGRKAFGKLLTALRMVVLSRGSTKLQRTNGGSARERAPTVTKPSSN